LFSDFRFKRRVLENNPPPSKQGMGVYTKLQNVSIVLTGNRVLYLLEVNSNQEEDLMSVVRIHLLQCIIYRVKSEVIIS
jgi:hypothetical protein